LCEPVEIVILRVPAIIPICKALLQQFWVKRNAGCNARRFFYQNFRVNAPAFHLTFRRECYFQRCLDIVPHI